MSVKASAWAASQTEVEAGQRWVLYVLADHADPYGRGAWPSVARLARMTGQSDRSVIRHLKALEAAGYIVRGDQSITSKNANNRRPTVYDVNVTRGTSQDRRGAGITPA